MLTFCFFINPFLFSQSCFDSCKLNFQSNTSQDGICTDFVTHFPNKLGPVNFIIYFGLLRLSDTCIHFSRDEGLFFCISLKEKVSESMQGLN